MGSCTSTLQKENIANIPPRKSHQSTSEHRRLNSASSNLHSHEIELKHIANEALITASFNRTLFSEDITYEYSMHCNILDAFNEPLIASWILRLTVENMTAFYMDTFDKYEDGKHLIPDQFGKVMKPKILSSLLDRVLKTPKLLKDIDPLYGESTARFLSIPYAIRCILQYNPLQYSAARDILQNFEYYDVIRQNNDKYKYLCCTTIVYDDIITAPLPQMTCYSYWIRSLHHKVDFLFNITSDNIFTVMMNDVAFNIAQVLKDNCDLDDLLAWIITDYLPKYLLFNHADERCNAQILYKYDPNEITFDDEDGDFYLQVMNNKLLSRHKDLHADELHDFCVDMRCQHMNAAPLLVLNNNNNNETSTKSEYISVTKTYASRCYECDESYDASTTKGAFIEEKSYQSTVSQYIALHDSDSREVDEDKYRIFFSAFLDEEGEDDINMYHWLRSLQKLNINLTERQMVDAFNFMLEDNEDNEGYIDFVDFTHFCQVQVDNNDAGLQRTQQILNSFIL